MRTYVASLEMPEEFVGLEDEMASFPTMYGRPGGVFALLYDGAGVVAGCGALRRQAADTGEVRRLYVAPELRGEGAGRALLEWLMDAARGLGYGRVVLDTYPALVAACGLYDSLGFTPTPPYWESPIPGTIYLERRLEGREGVTSKPTT